MRSYQASFGGEIWTTASTLMDGVEIHLLQNERGDPFFLRQFNNMEDANRIYTKLEKTWHPNYTDVLPIFQVEGEPGYFLAMEKRGETLKEFLSDADNKRRFYEGHRISVFYQKILTDLLLVTRHLIDCDIKCEFDLESIYILDTPEPHLSITQFMWRGCQGSTVDFRRLVPLLKSINEEINHEFGESMEIKQLLHCLGSAPSKGCIEAIATLPLFWSPLQRRLFPCRAWALLEYSTISIHNDVHQPFGINPLNWEAVITDDPALQAIKELSGVDFPRRMSTSIGASRSCLAFIRNSLSHFPRRTLHYFPGVRNEEDLAELYERKFPNYIKDMHYFAGVMENTLHVEFMPRKRMLLNLYK